MRSTPEGGERTRGEIWKLECLGGLRVGAGGVSSFGAALSIGRNVHIESKKLSENISVSNRIYHPAFHSTAFSSQNTQ